MMKNKNYKNELFLLFIIMIRFYPPLVVKIEERTKSIRSVKGLSSRVIITLIAACVSVFFLL